MAVLFIVLLSINPKLKKNSCLGFNKLSLEIETSGVEIKGGE